jgi:hypothetical protein
VASERDRQSYRKWQEELRAEEAAEQERIEAPIRAAEAEIQSLTRKIFATVRERLLTQKDVDLDGDSFVWIDPSVAGLQMPWQLAMAANADEYKRFIAAESGWYFHNPENMKRLLGYLERNGCQIFTQEMLKRAALRLDEYHLLEQRPAPPPPPEPVYVNLERDRSQERPEEILHEGWDEITGEPRSFTDYQVNRMSSEQFLKAFHLGRIFPSGVPVRNVVR